jgi:hypothetical protein
MKAGARFYRSYILRLWQEQEGGEWRSSLQDTITKDCQAFANLSELFAFLIQVTEQPESIPTVQFELLAVPPKDSETLTGSG